jgi:protein-S-isoprenylcysteine O-methyltransferase Ste14
MTSVVLMHYAYGQWLTVGANIILFLAFALGFIRPRKRWEWGSMGTFFGFIVAMFTEMFGFPLTIYALTAWLGGAYPSLDPFSWHHGHLLLLFLGLADSTLALTVLDLVSYGLVFLGLVLVHQGWRQIHLTKGLVLASSGLYARVRHPQYLGLSLISTGFLLMWPTLTTLVMFPVMIFAYYRLAKREDRGLEQRFCPAFLDYKRAVPAFFPTLRDF